MKKKNRIKERAKINPLYIGLYVDIIWYGIQKGYIKNYFYDNSDEDKYFK